MPEGEEEAPPGVRTMAVLRWALVGLMALAAAGALLSYFEVWPRAGVSASDKLYYCPMHPQVVQDHPGECPICSMTLVPKPEAAGKPAPQASMAVESSGQASTPQPAPASPEDPAARSPSQPAGQPVQGLATVQLSPERIQLLGMRTARVRRQALGSQLRTVGFVVANERGMSKIPTRFSGWIEKLLVDQTGQKVRRGQVLATVYSPELLSAQQELLSALRWAGESGSGASETQKMTASLAEDARRRLELLGISREEIQAIEKSGKPIRALPIRSPVSGTVTQKTAQAGAYVQPGMELFEVADLTSVWVLADLYENDLARVALGQSAKLQLSAYRGESFVGQVDFLYPTVDPTTRTRRVRLALDNKEGRLLPGMYGDVLFELPGEEALLVQAEAIVDTGESQYVFLAREGGTFEPRKVVLGARSGADVQVLEGLAEGETVVTTANFLIDSESRLHAAIEGMSQ